MLKKEITYTDYNGQERTEDFYFNLSKAELIEMQASVDGGLDEHLIKLVKNNNQPEIFKFFKDLVLKAYGEKSDDGRRFVKSKEISEAFSQTEAYSEFFTQLATNSKAGAEFINGIMPADLNSAADKAMSSATNSVPTESDFALVSAEESANR